MRYSIVPFLAANPTTIKGGKMRRTILMWRVWAVAGLMLFTISACATRPTTAPAAAEDQAVSQATAEKEQTRQQSLEEERLQTESDRRQYEIERNRFIYEDIFFSKYQYRLDETARRELEWKADWLLRHPEVKVLIEGHCDTGGSAEENLALGLRRAGEVKSFFLRRGIDRGRVSAISYGKERPIATGNGEEAQAKNRRVRTNIVFE
jgi:peptidoglycan-associated lipoprotein